MSDLPIMFERNLYRAVIRYKKDHPGMLEAITAARKAKEKNHEYAKLGKDLNNNQRDRR